MKIKPALFAFFVACILLLRLDWSSFSSLRLRLSFLDAVMADSRDEELRRSLLNRGEFRAAGILALVNEEYSLAAQHFSSAIAREEDMLAQYFLGTSYYELGEEEQALEQWRATDPNVASILVHQAAKANQLGNPSAAVEYSEMAIRLDPLLGVAYLQLGRAQATNENLNSALANYRRAAELVTNRYVLSSLYRQMGTLYGNMGKHKAAIQAFEKAMGATPDNYFAYLQLADAYLAGGQVGEAVSQLETAISLEPESVLAYLRMGDLYRDNHQPEEALAWYQEAKKVEPASGRVDYAIGSLFLKKGRVDEAILYLERSIDLGWKPYWLWFDLASAYELAGQREKAIKCYQRITELADAPEERVLSAWIELAKNYEMTGDSSKSENAWLQALNLDSQHPDIPDLIRERE